MNLRKGFREKSGEVHTSALNDVLFILLFFFLIISTLANPNVVKVLTPKAKTDTKAKQTVVVTVDSMQHFYVGTTLTSVDSLESAIARAAAQANDAEPTVVVNGDKKADWDNIMTVMKAAKASKLKVVAAIDNQ
jgi:biopolymer transport protein ExbD